MADVDFDNMEQTVEMDESSDIIPIGPTKEEGNEKYWFDGSELPFEIINGIPMYQKNHVVDNRCQIFERIGWDDLVGATYLATALNGKELVLRVGNENVLIPQIEASFLCKIIRITHNLGYLLRALYLEMFHFDACSRHLFLADLSSVRKDTSKSNSQQDLVARPHWCGGPIFAPMTYHDEDPISCRDELEAWLYLFIYLVKGTLPWENDRYDDVKWTKIKAINNGELFDGLPPQFNKILNVITHENATEPFSNDEYDQLEHLTMEIFRDIGGVENEDDNFDFERDPTEEEIPRFVVERKPISDEDLRDDITQSSCDEEDKRG